MNEITACHECDLLIELPEKVEQSKAVHCPRCSHKLTSGHQNPIDYVLAISFAALSILIIANFFPFMAFEASGQYRSITLAQASFVLYEQGFHVLSVLILLFIILLPATYLCAVIALVLPIKMQWKRNSPINLGVFIGWLLPWSMAEVFLIGVLVSLIKLVSLANIFMGIAFWSYVIFTILFTYLATIIDPYKLWHWVEWGNNRRYESE